MPFLNWSAEIVKYIGHHLPHWHQDNALQYVTFRLADSLPQTTLEQLQEYKDTFIKLHPKPWDSKTADAYYDVINPYYEEMLDRGCGGCILKAPATRKVLIDSLFFGDGTRYNLIAFVIMPNHVHLLMEDLNGEDVNKIIKSIQRYSTTRINRLWGRKGPLWMDDCFDRIVRSQMHLQHCLGYIVSNPRHLPPSDYSLYVKEKFFE